MLSKSGDPCVTVEMEAGTGGCLESASALMTCFVPCLYLISKLNCRNMSHRVIGPPVALMPFKGVKGLQSVMTVKENLYK